MRLEASAEASLLGCELAVANFRRDVMALGMHKKARILSNQPSYGLWGLYSSALQEAGLIKGSDRRLTETGRALTDAMLEVFGKLQWQCFGELASQGAVSRPAVVDTGSQLSALLKDQGIRKQLVSALMLEGDDANLRVALIGSYVIGLATMRHLLESPPLISTPQRKAAKLVGAAIQACVGF